jgi:hypothetical protein
MQESRVCDPKLQQLRYSSCQLLPPRQGVLFKTLQLQSDGDYTETGEQQQLKVVGLLGSGASSEAHEVQLLPASSSELDSTAGAVAAAAATPSKHKCGWQHQRRQQWHGPHTHGAEGAAALGRSFEKATVRHLPT